MALCKQTMTDEQRKSVVIEYLKADCGQFHEVARAIAEGPKLPIGRSGGRSW
jgi:hypothetical protein